MPKLIIANWKMHKDLASCSAFVEAFGLQKRPSSTTVVICPSFPFLQEVGKLKQVMLGCQNVAADDEGAFTGEVSAKMLASMGCTYALVGHSERRQLFHETDLQVNNKILQCHKYGITPILCIGETLDEREHGSATKRVAQQLDAALNGVTKSVIVAYEPLWAIGTGKSADHATVEEMRQLISKNLAKNKISGKILYGGSVLPENVSSFKKMDGFLVGGASLEVESFMKIVERSYVQ